MYCGLPVENLPPTGCLNVTVVEAGHSRQFHASAVPKRRSRSSTSRPNHWVWAGCSWIISLCARAALVPGKRSCDASQCFVASAPCIRQALRDGEGPGKALRKQSTAIGLGAKGVLAGRQRNGLAESGSLLQVFRADSKASCRCPVSPSRRAITRWEGSVSSPARKPGSPVSIVTGIRDEDSAAAQHPLRSSCAPLPPRLLAALCEPCHLLNA